MFGSWVIHVLLIISILFRNGKNPRNADALKAWISYKLVTEFLICSNVITTEFKDCEKGI